MLNIGSVEIEKPVLIGAGPLTSRVELLEEAEAAGAGAASLKLTFVKVPFPSRMRTFSIPGSALVAPTDRRLNLDEGVALAREAKKRVSMPVFANPGAAGDRLDEWRTIARAFQDAGVDGLELNFCCPNLDVSALEEGDGPRHGGMQIGQDPGQCARVTRAVKEVARVPVICKFLPNALDVVAVARACEEAGADAVHIVGLPAAGLPLVDPEDGGRPLVALTESISWGAANGPACLPSTLMASAQLARAISIPVIASGGIGDWRDCISALMWGASAVAVCTAVLWNGFEVVRQINGDLQDYLGVHGHGSWLDARGLSLKFLCSPDKVRYVDGWAEVDREHCTGCGRCLKPGHCNAVSMEDEKAAVDRNRCIGCGLCASVCPAGAIRLVGRGDG